MLPIVSAGKYERIGSRSTLSRTNDSERRYDQDRDRRADHREELAQRQRELRGSSNTRHGPATFMMSRVTNARSNGAPRQPPDITQRSDAEHRQQDGGDLGDHGGERLAR